VQIPTFDNRLFNVDLAAESDDYCQEVAGICAEAGVEITELSTHLQGQLVAVNPAYDDSFDAFAPKAVHGKPAARTEWAIDQVKKAAVASRRLGLARTVSFTGSLAFPFLYPWPQRPEGID
jgi:sugar phosphate isomerase/epimerase